MKKKMLGWIALVLATALFIFIIPKVTNRYSMTVMNTALLYFIGALGISMMLGMAGQLTFATIGFMGIGATFTILFSKTLAYPTAVSLVLSIIGTAVVAFSIGLALLRLKGSYFAFATIGFVQIINSLLQNFRPFMGGPDGTSAIPTLSVGSLAPQNLYDWFYVLMALAIVCGVIVVRIRKTYLGRALASIRDNEIAACSLGVNVYMTKVIAFTIAGAFAGLAGALYAHHNTFVSQSLFTFEASTTMVIMVMLGGVNSTIGVFVGALLVTMLPEWLRVVNVYLRLIYGIGVIFLMVFMPMGLAGLFKVLVAKVEKLFKKGKEVPKDGGKEESHFKA